MEEEAGVYWYMGSLAVGSCHCAQSPSCTAYVQSSGACGILPASPEGLRRALSPRAKRDHMHHSTYTESAQHGSANTRVTRARGTRAHVASLALNPRRYVPSAVRDAKRSNAKRSTARARDTCTTHAHNAAVHFTTVDTPQCTYSTLCTLRAQH